MSQTPNLLHGRDRFVHVCLDIERVLVTHFEAWRSSSPPITVMSSGALTQAWLGFDPDCLKLVGFIPAEGPTTGPW